MKRQAITFPSKGLRNIGYIQDSPNAHFKCIHEQIWGGGGSGAATLPNGKGHNIKCSTADVLSYANALIYIAKCLVVVIVN